MPEDADTDLKLRLESKVNDAEWQYLTAWRECVFPAEGRSYRWAPQVWHLLAFAQGDMPIGHIGFSRFEVEIQEQHFVVIGIGAVVVRPEYQGRGVPAQMFAEVHQQAPTLVGTDVFTLFCPARLVHYYQKHGYQLHQGDVVFLQNGEPTSSVFQFMQCGPLPIAGDLFIPSHPW